MLCYIKDFKSFKTIAKYDAVNYALPDGVDGLITINHKAPAELTKTIIGNWLIINDGFTYEEPSLTYEVTLNSAGGYDLDINGSSIRRNNSLLSSGGMAVDLFSKVRKIRQLVYYISECTPSDETLELKIVHPIYAFSRPVIYSGVSTYGGEIYNILLDNYSVNCPDSEYKMNYLDVESTDTTECTIEPDAYGYIVPSEVFEMARKDGVNIDFSITSSDRLKINVYSNSNKTVGNIIFGDGHSQLSSESYDESYCAKATVLHDIPSRLNWKYGVVQDGHIEYQDNWFICMVSEYIQIPSNSTVVCDAIDGYKYIVYYFDDNLNLISGTNYNQGKTKNNYSNSGYIVVLFSKNDETDIDQQESYNAISVTIFETINFYLSSENEISTTPPANRVHGAWKFFNASENESPLYVAIGAFSHNSDNHKIEFYSDQYFEYYQPVKLRLRNEVFETIITSRVHRNTDDRYYYTCGNLAITLTDKLKKIEKN